MPVHNCPCCRCLPDDDLDQQLAARVAAWKMYCEEHGHPIRGGRVAEIVAAELLGLKPKTLAGKRKSGNGPRVAHIPVNGSQYSYDLEELAAWESAQQSGESWKV